MSVNWDQNELKNLDDLGIRFQPNDSPTNTNQRYRDDYESRGNALQGFTNVLKFYAACGLIFGGTCALVKWPMPTLAILAGAITGKFIREMKVKP